MNRHNFRAATCTEGTRGRRNRLYGSSVQLVQAGEGQAVLGAQYGGDFVMFLRPYQATATQPHIKNIVWKFGPLKLALAR